MLSPVTRVLPFRGGRGGDRSLTEEPTVRIRSPRKEVPSLARVSASNFSFGRVVDGAVEGVAGLREPMVRIRFPPAGSHANTQLRPTSRRLGRLVVCPPAQLADICGGLHLGRKGTAPRREAFKPSVPQRRSPSRSFLPAEHQFPAFASRLIQGGTRRCRSRRSLLVWNPIPELRPTNRYPELAVGVP